MWNEKCIHKIASTCSYNDDVVDRFCFTDGVPRLIKPIGKLTCALLRNMLPEVGLLGCGSPKSGAVGARIVQTPFIESTRFF